METRRYQPIVKRVCLLLPFYFLTISPLSAQSFTQRLQNPVNGGGTVVIHQDASIDALVNGSVSSQRAAREQQRSGQPAREPQRGNAAGGSAGRDQRQASSSQRQTSDSQRQTSENQRQTSEGQRQRADSVAQGTGRLRQVTGYRIQVFVGGKTRQDRQRAEQTGNALRTLFPGQRVYVHFYSPRWICRMGNFRTYEEARAMLDEVIRLGYDSATIVRGRITVSN